MASQIPVTVRAQPPAAAAPAALRVKKRAGSPAVTAGPQATGSGSKKKKPPQIATQTAQAPVQVIRHKLINITAVFAPAPLI